MAEKITYSRSTERPADAGYHKAVGDQYFRRDRPFLCDRFVVSAFTIRAYYYNAVESILNSGASTTATNYFSGRLDGGSSLEASAADFIDSFSYRDKTTIWIINNAGGVVTSSSGFAVEKVRMPDYEEALAGDTGRARYVGHITDNGEKCMAVTRIIYSGDGEPMGAVRVISL